MKPIFIFTIIFLTSVVAKAQLWSEDFSGEADGATSGTAGGTLGGTWTTSYSGSGTFSKENVFAVGEVLHVSGTTSEGMWSTNTINIASVGYAIINVDIFSAFVNADDYVRISYVLDGIEVPFYELMGGTPGNNFAPDTPASAIVAGNTLQVKIYSRNDPGFFAFLNGQYAIDNVTVTAAPIIYSRKSGTWTDATAGTGTWSLTGHSGAACACYPLNTQVAIIGSDHTVTLPTSQITIGTPPTLNLAPGAVDVYGTLQYNVNAVTLGIQKGLFRVRNGGTVNSSVGTIAGEQISFLADVGGATLTVDAGGTASIEDLVLAIGATNFHYLQGDGILSISDDILINGSDASLTNNLTSSLAIGDDLIFDSDNSTFTNNGTVTFSGDIAANNTNDDGNEVINNSGATLSFANLDGLATGTGNGAFLSISNSGTINQTGTFLDIQGNTNAANDVNNLDGAIWNYSGTGHDLDLRLFANNGTNDFNYTRSGAQNIITPVTGDGYSNISLTTSGAKTALGSFSVYGNWLRTGTSTFAPSTFTVSLQGASAQSITAVGGETFNNLIINNSFGTSPQITLNSAVTVASVLTMTDGNVNLNGNTFRLLTSTSGALVHGLTAASGWMYGGNFTRQRPTTAITIGAAHSLFPLGSAGDWRPFFVGQNANANSDGTMTVSHTNSTSTSDVNIPDVGPPATISRRHDSFWTVSTTGISAGSGFILRAGGTNFGTIASNAHLRMCTDAGVVGNHSAGSGGPTDWRVNRTAVPFASLTTNNFHLASTNEVNSPLPIELLSFTSILNNNIVELKWSTASETNNDFFTIERAIDLEKFEAIIEEDGVGTSRALHHYKVVDSSPLFGRSYYRLKQTDFDGKYTYSGLQVIDYEGQTFATLTAFPNPVKGSSLTIKLEGLKEQTQVPVQILNMQGEKIFEKVLVVKNPGSISEEILNAYALPPGLYIIKGGETLNLIQKIVVE